MRNANQYFGTAPRQRRLAVVFGRLGWAVLVLATLAAGCAHSRNKNRLGLIPPPLPPFLTGPMAVLLTNTPGFAGRVALEFGSPADPAETISGQLLCRGPKLLFEPDANSPLGKRFRAGGFVFLWNVAERGGWLVSEALQGYAPISSQVQVTKVIIHAATAASEQVDGHACQETEVEVASADGSTRFQVWRATDLNAIPLRIASATDTRPLRLSLSRLQLEVPSDRVFLPPAGFTRYDSAETMMAEMAMRQENLWRKPAPEPGEMEPPPRQPDR